MFKEILLDLKEKIQQGTGSNSSKTCAKRSTPQTHQIWQRVLLYAGAAKRVLFKLGFKYGKCHNVAGRLHQRSSAPKRHQKAYDKRSKVDNLCLRPSSKKRSPMPKTKVAPCRLPQSREGIPFRLSTAASFSDGTHRTGLPANLLQGATGLFGAHKL